MDVLIISQYLRNIENLDGNNSRFIYIANLLSKNKDVNVEIVTSNFMHGPKRHAVKVDSSENFKLTALDEPGYLKNVSLKRLISHRKLSLNLKTYLMSRKKPDVIYCAVPSLDVAAVASKYCKKNNIRFIVDIQDLWPEAFKIALNVPIISNLLFLPMTVQANKIYKSADDIVAVSQTYCDRALKVNDIYDKALPVFLGTSLDTFDKYKSQQCNYNKNSDEIWLAYCGTLGHSYDLITVFDALRIVKEKKYNVKFIIMGDGPRREEFENYSNKYTISSLFTGSLPYNEMCSLLNLCDIVINPIVHNAAQSIINKHADYAMSGLPVINTQESNEYRRLIEDYNMGFNCKNGDYVDLANKLIELISNPELREKMGVNARKCAIERFDRNQTYQDIVQIILLK